MRQVIIIDTLLPLVLFWCKHPSFASLDLSSTQDRIKFFTARIKEDTSVIVWCTQLSVDIPVECICRWISYHKGLYESIFGGGNGLECRFGVQTHYSPRPSYRVRTEVVRQCNSRITISLILVQNIYF